MATTIETEYAAFEQKVKKTVYIDNLSPEVTKSILSAALDQFGNVLNVRFIPNYSHLRSIINTQAALVEMEIPEQAENIVSGFASQSFMIMGMPRPVNAVMADSLMFDERPRVPGSVVTSRWLDPKDPDFNVANKIKTMTKKHALQASFVLKQQIAEEKKLHEQQEANLEVNMKKLQLLIDVTRDGSVNKLREEYEKRGFFFRTSPDHERILVKPASVTSPLYLEKQGDKIVLCCGHNE